jgi:eukaryotic-like serine/threonine-protein kinase
VDETTVTGDLAARRKASDAEGERYAAGSRIGRYVVSGSLGMGGMGVVLDAHDPDLDRRVALKLVRTGRVKDSTLLRDRLLREAQALARLSHPNVVAVYDVGTLDDGVYVAMEYVPGPTLRVWLESATRTPAEILRMFAGAARGLAAAHAKALVHRDFKPENVIIGDDGRVRVLDFGLARAEGAHERPATPVPIPSPSPSLDTPLTEHGTVMGTPRYMAPEQHRGLVAEAPADVFAFCVALYEALYRSHPFGPPEVRLGRVRSGELDPPRAVDGVPAHVREVLERGLARKPGDRPTLAEILRQIERDRWRTLRMAGVAVGLVAVAAGSAWGLAQMNRPTPPCSGAEAQLAAVWNDAAREAVRSRFAAAKQPYVAALRDHVIASLDDYGRRWAIAHRQVCRATHVERTQSAALLDQRMACLDARRTQLGALVHELADPVNAGAIDSALSAVGSLVDLEACDDPQRFGPTVALPVEPARRDEVRAIRTELAAVSARIALGSVAEAQPRVTELATRADATAFTPLRAEAADTLAYARLEAGENDAVEPLLQSMIVLGSEAGNDTIVATGWIELVRLRGTTQARVPEALAMRFAAEAAIARAGAPPRLAADYQVALAEIYDTAGDFAASRAAQEKVLALRRSHRGERHVQVASSLVNLGATLFALGDLDGAEARAREALGIYEATVGADSPRIAVALTNLAQVHIQRGQLDEAEKLLQRALTIKERALGPDHRGVGITLLAVAEVHLQRKAYAEALPLVERAERIFKATLAPDHPYVATATSIRGRTLVWLGRFDEGCPMMPATLPIIEKTYGKAGAVEPLMIQAQCELHAGRRAAAIAVLEPLLAAMDPLMSPVDTERVRALLASAQGRAYTSKDVKRNP